MAWLRKHKIASIQQGDVISASDLAKLGKTLDWLSSLNAAPPLELLSTANGPLLRYPGMLFEIYIAVANGTITARSGGTPGTGNATIQTWNGTALASLGVDLPVRNWNAATGGIATGKYMVALKIAGALWPIAAEC